LSNTISLPYKGQKAMQSKLFFHKYQKIWPKFVITK